MRKPYQEGSIKKYRGAWIAQWWEDGHRRNRTIGRVSMITKTEAKVQLASIVTPLNIKQSSGSRKVTLSEFVKLVYVPFYRRKWKFSTAQANEQRINYHLLPEFKNRTLGAVWKLKGPNQKRITKASLRNHLQALTWRHKCTTKSPLLGQGGAALAQASAWSFYILFRTGSYNQSRCQAGKPDVLVRQPF